MMGRARIRGILRRAAPVALFLLGLALAPSARAAGDGVVGTVVNKTTGKAVPDLPVTLHEFGEQSEIGRATATTTAGGVFAFGDPAEGATSFQLSASYKGATYLSDVLSVRPGRPTEVTLEVYEPTTDPRDVTVTKWVIWVDREGNGVALQHDLEWNNGGTTAFVGSGAAGDGGGRIVTQVPLAPGATNFQFLGLFLQSPGQVSGTAFVSTQPLVPGASRATLRYTTTSLESLRLPVTLPTEDLQLFVPSDVEVSAGGLTAAGEITDRGVTYQVFTATNLAAGDDVTVSLSGLTGGGGRSPLTLVLLGAGIVAFVGVVAVWRLGRDRSKRPVPRPRPASHPKRAAPALAKTDGHDGDDADADLLIDEIAALDLAFERGLLDRHTHESLRTAAKNRLLRVRGARAGNGPAR